MSNPLIIVGGGLAGSLAALAMARAQPGRPLLLLEAGAVFGGNHTWSFFDGDVPDGAAGLVAELAPVRWPRHRVFFPGRGRELALAYNAVESPALDRLVRRALPAGVWRTGCDVRAIAPDSVVLADGTAIAACGVIDARGPRAMPGLDLGWQKFVGIEFAAAAPDPACATVMDACVAQSDGYRFVYTLPLAADRVLVEDTYYSENPALDATEVAARVRAYAAAQGIAGAELRHEAGALPIIIGGDPARFWPAEDAVARIGLAGGFFHPITGYSFGMALRIAGELAALADWSGPALAAWTRARFLAHWRAGVFDRMLNRMMFRAAAPDQRWRVFSHFYRLPEATIARFYAGRLSATDRMRLLSGRPPVPVLAAVGALARWR